ncbi:MAG: adenylosuccinate synthase [Planctomycetota bacterium]
MSENVLVVGLQWGDEGKGKVIDVLTDRHEAVVRFQGGANAGHTVKVGDQTFILHLIPSGILHENKLCVIGNGLVVDPECLLTEIEELEDRGIPVSDQLVISDRAHVVMPYHKMLDGLHEELLGDDKIETTQRGIGPCYSDKAARTGIRFCELLEPDTLRERLESALEVKNRELESIYGVEPLDIEEVYEQFCEYAERLEPFVDDTVRLMHELGRQNRSILFEGAQGTMLDINYGTYPFVTSSNVCAGGATVGTGLPPSRIDRVLGIVKAYCSRVGGGPFPTEQDNEIGETLRELGDEYGSTTGRPRRCGWLDAVALRHTVAINGVSGISLMLLDVLSEFETIKVCTGYRIDGEKVDSFPASVRQVERLDPIYEEFEGWKCDITGARTMDDLPAEARQYIAAVEQLIGVNVEMVSVGPGRRQMVEVDGNG